jgi:CBS domain-containing protein
MLLGYIVLLIAILVILFILYMRKLFPVTTKSIDSIYDLAETGDVVFFVHEHAYPMFRYVRPFMSHIAMIIVLPKTNKKYVIEIHAEGDKKRLGVNKKGGVNMYPLEWRINNYKGNVYLSKLNTNNKPSCKDIIRFINKIPYYIQNIQFEENFKEVAFKRILKNITCLPVVPDKTNTMFCTTFIGYCLQKLNIIDDNISHKDIILPVDFLFLKNRHDKKLFNKFYLIKPDL